MLLVALYLLAGPALGVPGLEPLTGALGCIAEVASVVCTDGKALDAANFIAVSPDGRNVYVTSSISDAVAVFDREPPTGELTQLAGLDGCVSEDGTGGQCTDGRELDGAQGVAVSPDGRNVYVTAVNGGIAIFDRSVITGDLTQKAASAGCVTEDGSGETCINGVAVTQPRSVAVSPDGRNVYVASTGSDAVAVFDRDVSTGALTQKGGLAACVSETGTGGSCADGVALDDPRSVTVSADGRNVYVASATSDAVATFDRDPETGALTQKAGIAACVSETGTGGVCRDGIGLDGARWVTVSPDGLTAYIASEEDSVAVLNRNRSTGELTLKLGNSTCTSETGTGGLCRDGVALDAPSSVVVSPDGRNVYVTASISDGVAIFDRTTAFITIVGALDQKTGPAGCVTSGGGGCTQYQPVDSAQAAAISPDGLHLYVASLLSDNISVLRRPLLVYDIDGDGLQQSLVDGLLLVRYFFGLRGDPLIASAVNLAGCTRCTAAAIEAYIASLNVP